MTKKIGDKSKVGGVQSTKRTAQVEGTDSISRVGQVKAATGVAGVKRAGAVNAQRMTRAMSVAEREEIFRLINEEAEKLASEGGLSPTRQKMVADAVKMAIDTGLLPSDDDKGNSKA